MAVQGTDQIILSRGGTLYKEAVSSLPSGGGGGVSGGAQVTNAASFNANQAAAVTFGTSGPSYGSGLAANALGVLCSFDGTVRVSGSLYFTGTPARGSVALQVTVGGSTTGPLYNQSYVRNSGGHNENGTVIPPLLVTVTSGQIVGINTTDQAATGTLTCAVGDAVLLVERVA